MTEPKPGTGGQRGAQPAETTPKRRRPWWLLALLAVIAIVVLLLLLSRCGNSNNAASGAGVTSTSASAAATSQASATTASATATTEPATTAPTTAPQSAPTPTSAAPAPPAAPGALGASAALTSQGQPLLPLATAATNSKYTALAGQAATGKQVVVQSVPANEGFWVGTSETDRVWVQLIGRGESPEKVTPGAKASFTGKIVANPPNYPATVGLTAAEGAAQLTSQGAHIEVPQNGLSLSK